MAENISVLTPDYSESRQAADPEDTNVWLIILLVVLVLIPCLGLFILVIKACLSSKDHITGKWTAISDLSVLEPRWANRLESWMWPEGLMRPFTGFCGALRKKSPFNVFHV